MHHDPILAAFDRRLRRSPEAPMVVGSRHETSVAEVDRLRRAAAARLAPGELGAGSLVGLAAPNGPGFLAAFLALRQAGCTALLFDWRTPATEKEHIAEVLGAGAVLHCRAVWPEQASDFSLLRARGAPGRREAGSEEVAAVKLTSGSTGAPRGIVTPSCALVADDQALARSMGLCDDERILASLPLSHSYGLSSVAMPALMRDAVLVVPEEGDPLDPLRVARSRQVTFLPTVPAFLQALVKRARPPALPPSLRLVVSAGAPLDPGTAVRFREVYDQHVHVFYGASECGGITYDRDGTAGERGSLGTPVDGVRVTLDPVCEESGRGTVTVTSPAVARGYLHEDGARLGGGSFRTRDLGVFRGAELFLEGRLDGLINVKGKKVNPREVERILAQLEGVEEAVTLGVSRPGQGGEIVRSFVACRPGSLSYETVHAWCRRHLAEHKVPRSIILLEKIPKTGRGKLDRAALLAMEPGSRRG